MDEYIKQATEFLQKTYTKMKIRYVGLAVQKEYTQLARLFTPEQMEELAEID